MRRYFIAFVFLGAICGERAAAQTLVKTAFKFSFGLVRCVAEGIKANKLELVKLSDDAGKRPFNPAQTRCLGQLEVARESVCEVGKTGGQLDFAEINRNRRVGEFTAEDAKEKSQRTQRFSCGFLISAPSAVSLSVLCGKFPNALVMVNLTRIFMNAQAKLFFAVALFLLTPVLCRANVTLPDVLSSGMVLQREQPVPVWGRASVGETVTVRFAGQTKRATADANGSWRVVLDKLKANARPAVLSVEGVDKIELTDILVGEVWLVSGQSNMQWRLFEATNGETAVVAANYPNLRLFNVSRAVGFKHAPPPLAVWQACTPQTVRDFSAIGYFFGIELQKALGVPVGLINSSYGGSQAEAWTPLEYLNANPDLRPTVERTKTWEAERPRVKVEYEAAIQKWREDSEKAKAAGARPSPSPAVPDALREYRIASSIYDGMIAPLIPFALRGTLWYQGESNEARAQQYAILLPALIHAWRERWGYNFPFGVIQLPNYREPNDAPTDEAWSHIREAQRRTALSVKNTGLIVTIDVGEARDIHPKNKLDIGMRAARWALADAYGRKLTKSGPMLRSAKVDGAKIILTFDQAGAGLRIHSGDKLAEFAIAGADKKWSWAQAKIIGKNKIEVWSDAVPQPLAVRYAFNNNPRRPNLTNDTGLPAAPFRTDDWPGPTDGKR